MRSKAESPPRTVVTDATRTPLKVQENARQRRTVAARSFFREWGACILVLTICALAVYQYLETARSFAPENGYLRANRPEGVAVRKAPNQTNVTGVGFVLLGMGPFARQLKCEAAAESLRTHGGWTGAIYLLTDAPKCFVENQVWSDCGIDAEVIDVDDDLSSGFTMPSLYKTKGNRFRSKKYKTRIFELISDPSIEVLIYLDCDMLIAGVDHGVEEFVREHMNGFNAETQLFVFPENNPTKINGVVHTGIFIAHRKWSKSVLQRWEEQLDTGMDASDQAAFVRAGIVAYQFVDEYKYLYRPRCDRDDCLTQEPLLFNHINGARCWSQGKHKIQTFVDRWDLCTYKTHNYCFPWYMTQFAMSWWPYTSCTKMEEERSVHE